jgi:hypothetical protein
MLLGNQLFLHLQVLSSNSFIKIALRWIKIVNQWFGLWYFVFLSYYCLSAELFPRRSCLERYVCYTQKEKKKKKRVSHLFFLFSQRKKASNFIVLLLFFLWLDLSKIQFWLFIFFSIGFFSLSLFATFFYQLGTSLFPLSASCCYFFFWSFLFVSQGFCSSDEYLIALSTEYLGSWHVALHLFHI